MMYIRANENGVINLYGALGLGVEYTGELPEDFEDNTDKYLFVNGEISINPDWVNLIKIDPITLTFPEGTVEVIDVPVNYKLNKVTCQVNVIYNNGQRIYKEFIADNSTIMPSGKGQFEELFAAIEAGEGFNDLVRSNLMNVYSQGRLF